MFWVGVALVGVVVVFLWLKQTTVKEQTIHTTTSVSMNDLLDFLCCPVNLEKYHPYIQKVTDVQETTEFVNFRIIENLGLGGKTVVPMVLTKHRHSHVTAVLRLENVSTLAKVILTMNITDQAHTPPNPGQASFSEGEKNNTLSRINLLVHVEAPRFLNFFIPAHLVSAWTMALDKTKSLLEH